MQKKRDVPDGSVPIFAAVGVDDDRNGVELGVDERLQERTDEFRMRTVDSDGDQSGRSIPPNGRHGGCEFLAVTQMSFVLKWIKKLINWIKCFNWIESNFAAEGDPGRLLRCHLVEDLEDTKRFRQRRKRLDGQKVDSAVD